MKKIVLFSLIVVFMTGCNEKLVLCDAGYTWEFFVKNETMKEIMVSNDLPNEAQKIIATGERKLVTERGDIGPCDNKELLEDKFSDGDAFRIVGTGFIGVEVGPNGYPFTMTVGGEAISDEIWLRKYWSFEGGYYSWTYTLTVTDELLASLPQMESAR